MGVFRQFGEYVGLSKRDPDRPTNSAIKFMHGVNRLSIYIFLLCMIILAYKLLRK